jgi:hypothetical protein
MDHTQRIVLLLTLCFAVIAAACITMILSTTNSLLLSCCSGVFVGALLVYNVYHALLHVHNDDACDDDDF